MLNPTQILLIIVVSVLTVILAIIGMQIFYILREGRRSIEKVNKMLDDVGSITSSVAKPIINLSSSISSFSGITGLLSWIFKKKNKEEKEDE